MKSDRSCRAHSVAGFTLIELLIVVAIIAILAAIAVPNFLEAQTRAKISRAQADVRTIATAVEAYIVDNNRYPSFFLPVGSPVGERAIFRLTTPVAYLTSIPSDPFQVGKPKKSANVQKNFTLPWGPSYRYFEYQIAQGWPADGWSVRSMGPDTDWDLVGDSSDGETTYFNGVYDATNGTLSNGDVMRFGGGMSKI